MITKMLVISSVVWSLALGCNKKNDAEASSNNTDGLTASLSGASLEEKGLADEERAESSSGDNASDTGIAAREHESNKKFDDEIAFSVMRKSDRSRTLVLQFEKPKHAKELIYSNDEGFDGAEWSDNFSDPSLTLPFHGRAKVYLKFRDKKGRESPVYVASSLVGDAMDIPSEVNLDASFVWTGSELILWGADEDESTPRWRFKNDSSQWQKISVVGAPSPRRVPSLFWNGSKLVVWGGMALPAIGDKYLKDGGMWDPASDSWTPISGVGAPSSVDRLHANMGVPLFGDSSQFFASSNLQYSFDTATQNWTALAPEPYGIQGNTRAMVWTGSQLLVWGGFVLNSSPENIYHGGASYDPTTDTWSALSMNGNPPPATIDAFSAWAGSEMIIWGGRTLSEGPYQPSNSGSLYDPSLGTWRAMNIEGAPRARAGFPESCNVSCFFVTRMESPNFL